MFYRHYVDDTFCLFHSENQALLFFNYINSRHPNIRFTMEKETDHKIPFLDVLINNETHFPVTSVYGKRTFKINNGWVFTRTSQNSPKSFRRIYFQSIWFKTSLITTSHLLVKTVIPWLASLTLHVPFTLNYLTLVLSLVSRRERFATLLNAFVITLILS